MAKYENIFERDKLYNELEVEQIAIKIASLSPCNKRKVGAVLALESFQGPLERPAYKIVASGYNYNPFSDICELTDGTTDPSVVHAEVDCIENYILSLHQLDVVPCRTKLVMLVTHMPCEKCAAELVKENIKFKVVTSFMKFSHTKPRMALVPASLDTACARALTYGARKYKVNNWRQTPDIEEYISALKRHFDAWREGEDNDPESGLNHLDHMAANLSFLIELKDLPKLKQ